VFERIDVQSRLDLASWTTLFLVLSQRRDYVGMTEGHASSLPPVKGRTESLTGGVKREARRRELEPAGGLSAGGLDHLVNNQGEALFGFITLFLASVVFQIL